MSFFSKNNYHPADYIPTEQEHRVAYLIYMLDDIYYSYLLGINMVRTGKIRDDLRKNIDGTESLIEADLNCIDEMFKNWRDKGTKEIWEANYDYEQFKKDHLQFLAEAHFGDCTCQPSSCMRCRAESLYKIPLTATWCKSCEFQGGKFCVHGKEKQ